MSRANLLGAFTIDIKLGMRRLVFKDKKASKFQRIKFKGWELGAVSLTAGQYFTNGKGKRIAKKLWRIHAELSCQRMRPQREPGYKRSFGANRKTIFEVLP